MSRLPAILLAAGRSSRMGDFKPLLPLAGTPVLHRVLASLRTSGSISEILLVTGHRAADIEASLATLPGGGVKEHLRALFNPQHATGEMLSSLLTGLAALPPSAPGFLLALADQPAVRPETIASLVAAFFQPTPPSTSALPQAKTPISTPPMQSVHPPLVIPIALGKRGHPVVISSPLVPEIRSLSPGESLKTVVHRHLAHATLVPVDDPSIHDDLDTPADFARAQAAASRHFSALESP